MVRDLPLSREDVVLAVVGYLDAAGYGRFAPHEMGYDVDALLATLHGLKPGDVLERRLEELRVRVLR